MISSNNVEQTFVKTGYRNKKKTLDKEKGFLLMKHPHCTVKL